MDFTQERKTDFFLFDSNQNPNGPGTYDTTKRLQQVIVKPVFGVEAKKNLTEVEKAQVSKPAFGQASDARPDDIRKWETGFVTYNPGPSDYNKKDSFGNQIIKVENLTGVLTP